jgi:hypothetical protein
MQFYAGPLSKQAVLAPPHCPNQSSQHSGWPSLSPRSTAGRHSRPWELDPSVPSCFRGPCWAVQVLHPQPENAPSRVRSIEWQKMGTTCKMESRLQCEVAENKLVAPSFNGRTADSGSAYRGSNPWGAANLESVTWHRKTRARKPTQTVSKKPIFTRSVSRRMAHLRHTCGHKHASAKLAGLWGEIPARLHLTEWAKPKD